MRKRTRHQPACKSQDKQYSSEGEQDGARSLLTQQKAGTGDQNQQGNYSGEKLGEHGGHFIAAIKSIQLHAMKDEHPRDTSEGHQKHGFMERHLQMMQRQVTIPFPAYRPQRLSK